MCITFFLNSSFTLHISSMFIFFVAVLETKKLLIHLLLTYLIDGSSYSELVWKFIIKVYGAVTLKKSFSNVLYKIVTENHFSVRHKNCRKCNQQFKLLFDKIIYTFAYHTEPLHTRTLILLLIKKTVWHSLV